MKLNPFPRTLALAIGASVFAIQAHAATPAGTSITNQASATYLDSTATPRTAQSNIVITTVQQVASVTVSAGTAKNGSANGTVSFPHTITNNGNGADTFTLGSSNTGAFSMASVVYYLDANSDGIADNATPMTTTGSLAAGASVHVVAVATLPAGVTLGATNSLVVTATSVFNAATTANATDVTTVVAATAVDLTSNTPGLGAPGAGPGVEASAVTTNTTSAGTTTRFTMYLNNAGSGADTFNLGASTDPTFGTTTLPSGWTVVFKDAGNNVITNATVAGGANTMVYADVTVSPGTPPATVDLYFRAMSPTTNVNDRLHDAIIVTAAAGTELSIAKTQALDANCDGIADTAFSNAPITAGAIPGACIRYEITATNNGAAAISAVVLSDTTPANTTYHFVSLATGAINSLGLATAPLPGAAGVVQGGVLALAPAASIKLSFGVRINP